MPWLSFFSFQDFRQTVHLNRSSRQKAEMAMNEYDMIDTISIRIKLNFLHPCFYYYHFRQKLFSMFTWDKAQFHISMPPFHNENKSDLRQQSAWIENTRIYGDDRSKSRSRDQSEQNVISIHLICSFPLTPMIVEMSLALIEHFI